MKELNILDFRIKQMEFILREYKPNLLDSWIVGYNKHRKFRRIFSLLNKRYDSILSNMWSDGIFI